MMPNELVSLSYPDDLDQAPDSEWKRFGFDLEAFADMFSVTEAEELNSVAEAFDLHYSAMVPPPAPSWACSQQDNHHHLAHVRAAPCPRGSSASSRLDVRTASSSLQPL